MSNLAIAGNSLDDQIQMAGGLPVQLAVKYFKQLLEVLIYLKQNYVLHENINTYNLILRSPKAELVMVGYGLSQKLSPENPVIPAGEQFF